jgi:transposase
MDDYGHDLLAFKIAGPRAARQPLALVAKHVKETDTRLWRMLTHNVEAAYPLADWSNMICVGRDEMSVLKGHNYVSVFCDLLRKRVLFAVKGRDKKVWESFVQAPESHNGHHRAIREVSMDMSPSYIAGVQERAPNSPSWRTTE